jgi:ParB/RepB/Spo0J family partition protein
MKGHFATKPLSELKRYSSRVRKRSEAELKSLAESWLRQPIHPIVCRPDLTVADGNGRLDGLELLGKTEAEVFITDEDLSDDQLTEIGLITAYHRAPLDGYEQAVAIQKIKAARPGVTNKELGEQLGIDPSMLTRLLSLFECLPEVQDAARDGKLGPSEWYAIKKSADQLGALSLKLGGASRDELERHVRQKANGNTPAVRTSKIKCQLAGGATVTVAASEISLDEAIEALKDALKAMTKARDTGLDAKTAQAVWRDVARNGA